MLRKLVFIMVLVSVMVAASVGLTFAQAPGKHHIHVNLPEYTLYHYVNNELVEVYPISIGAKVSPTPITTDNRRFEIYIKVVDPAWRSPTTRIVMPPGPTNPLGSRWLGLMTIDRVRLTGAETWVSLAQRYGVTTAAMLRANGLTANAPIVRGTMIEIPRVQGYGIHGTIAPQSIGTSVSLGCMRMHNRDVERLFAALPNGIRVPVHIDYEPVVQRIDLVTGNAYLEVFYDVYGRVQDWPQYLAGKASVVGITPPAWFTDFTGRPFKGPFSLSREPMVRNNGILLAVGAIDVDGSIYVPMPVAENLVVDLPSLEELDVVEANGLAYFPVETIVDLTGKSYYFDQMQNTLSFSVTSLFYEGEFVGYNRIFLHPEAGPMISFSELAALVGEERARTLKGVPLGNQHYYDVTELQKLNLTICWDQGSGRIALTEQAIH